MTFHQSTWSTALEWTHPSGNRQFWGQMAHHPHPTRLGHPAKNALETFPMVGKEVHHGKVKEAKSSVGGPAAPNM